MFRLKYVKYSRLHTLLNMYFPVW